MVFIICYFCGVKGHIISVCSNSGAAYTLENYFELETWNQCGSLEHSLDFEAMPLFVIMGATSTKLRVWWIEFAVGMTWKQVYCTPVCSRKLTMEIHGQVVRMFVPGSKHPGFESRMITISHMFTCSLTGLSKAEWGTWIACDSCTYNTNEKDPLGSFEKSMGIFPVPRATHSGRDWNHWASMAPNHNYMQGTERMQEKKKEEGTSLSLAIGHYYRHQASVTDSVVSFIQFDFSNQDISQITC
jgi:hypothetical protein